MKHIVVFDGDLRRKGQTAGLANQDLFADLPVRAGLAFSNQKFDFFLVAHLQPPEFFFYFAHAIGKPGRGDDIRLPAQIPID